MELPSKKSATLERTMGMHNEALHAGIQRTHSTEMTA